MKNVSKLFDCIIIVRRLCLGRRSGSRLALLLLPRHQKSEACVVVQKAVIKAGYLVALDTTLHSVPDRSGALFPAFKIFLSDASCLEHR